MTDLGTADCRFKRDFGDLAGQGDMAVILLTNGVNLAAQISQGAQAMNHVDDMKGLEKVAPSSMLYVFSL